MASQSDRATATSEESAKSESGTTQATGGFVAELMKVAKDLGHEVGETTAQSEPDEEQREQEADPAVESENDEETESEEETAKGEEEESKEEEKTESEEDDKPKARQEWPEDAKARISEETSKRKRRTDERDKAVSERDEAKGELAEIRQERDALRRQLSVAQRPAPTAADPLIDVHDEQTLQEAETQIEGVLAFAEKHRDGAEGVVVGKDSDGKEIKQDFTPEQIADIKIAAERRLRKEIPQRRALLVQRAQMDAEAVKIYPDFKDPESKVTQEAAQLLRQVPELLRFPDALLWVGHAIAGRNAYLAKAKEGKNGKSGNGTVDRIVESSKTKLAPSTTKSRAFESTRSRADLKQLEKRLEERGDPESAEAYVGALLSKRKSGKSDLVNQ